MEACSCRTLPPVVEFALLALQPHSNTGKVPGSASETLLTARLWSEADRRARRRTGAGGARPAAARPPAPTAAQQSMATAASGSSGSDAKQPFPVSLAECMQALKAMVTECSPAVILSSAWRTDPQGRSEVSVQLGLHGIPTFRDWTKQLPGNPEEQRPKEILEWVRAHQPSTWVAIDDWDLVDPESPPVTESSVQAATTLQGHFVRTNQDVGLTAQLANDARAALL